MKNETSMRLCPYEDCINDEMRHEDYQEGKKLELISGAKEYKTSESHRVAQKKYLEENKEKWKEYNQKSRQKKSSLALARSVGGKE